MLAYLLSLLSLPLPAVSPRTIYVPDDYSTIQGAVDAASPGDMIVVRDGIYYESITINKPITIKAENIGKTIIDAQGSKGITITANGATINGLTVRNALSGMFLYSSRNRIINCMLNNDEGGISLFYSSNNTIINCTLNNIDTYGIYLYFASNNYIENFIINNSHTGMFLYYSYNDTIINFTIENSKHAGMEIVYSDNNIIVSGTISNIDCYGMYLTYSSNNDIVNLIINSNGWPGIFLRQSKNNTIVNCTIRDNYDGICLHNSSSNNRIINCIISNNNENGICLKLSSNNNTIANCSITNNLEHGIMLDSSNNNTVVNCTLAGSKYGVYLIYCSGNIFYLNNFFNNTNHVGLDGAGMNYWNSTRKLTYYYDGKRFTSFLGNYYSDYSFTDSNSDGIYDSQRVFDANNIDYCPLVTPTWQHLPMKKLESRQWLDWVWTEAVAIITIIVITSIIIVTRIKK